ncbi:DNA (cytosine-5)-methyltransferase 1, partial [Linum grandiflorum]
SLQVPNYAISFKHGRSTKPFGRLWWDETVSTVMTRAEPHNHALLHPLQDRVLTVRENARLQGFPDQYKLTGPIKERYAQVGNAVAVPVARALGFSLGKALTHNVGRDPLFRLPSNYLDLAYPTASTSSQDDA